MRNLVFLLAAALCLSAEIAGGTYKGTWSGSATGDFRIVLTPASAGAWNADVMFTMGSDEVKTKVTSVKVDGNKLEVVYQFDLQGTRLQSAISGELKDKLLEGSYKTTTVPDGGAVDEGTWKTSAQ